MATLVVACSGEEMGGNAGSDTKRVRAARRESAVKGLRVKNNPHDGRLGGGNRSTI